MLYNQLVTLLYINTLLTDIWWRDLWLYVVLERRYTDEMIISKWISWKSVSYFWVGVFWLGDQQCGRSRLPIPTVREHPSYRHSRLTTLWKKLPNAHGAITACTLAFLKRLQVIIPCSFLRLHWSGFCLSLIV